MALYLRELDERDIDGMLEWMRDPQISKAFRFRAEDMDSDSVANFIKEAKQDAENIHLAVADETDDRYLGTVSLKKIDRVNKHAEYAISLRKAAHGTGAAWFATEEILRIAFEDNGLNRVYLNVLSDNSRAIGFYQKFGFVYEGEFKQHLLIDGEKKNLKWFRILKDEFYDR